MKKIMNFAIATQMILMSPAVFAQNYNPNAPATRPYVYGPNGGQQQAPAVAPAQPIGQPVYSGQQPINLDQRRYQNGGGYYGGGYRQAPPPPNCYQIPPGYPGSCVQQQKKNNTGELIGAGLIGVAIGTLIARGGIGGPVVGGPAVPPPVAGPGVGPAVPPPANYGPGGPNVAPAVPPTLGPPPQVYMQGFNNCMLQNQCGPNYMQPGMTWQGNNAGFYFQPGIQGPVGFYNNNGLPGWIQPGTQCRTYQNFVVNAGNINMQYNQVNGMACMNNGQWVPVPNPNGQMYITNGQQWGPGAQPIYGNPGMINGGPGYAVQPMPPPPPPRPVQYQQPVQVRPAQMQVPPPQMQRPGAPATLPPLPQNGGIVNNGGFIPQQPVAQPRCGDINPRSCPQQLPPQPQAMR